MEKVLLSCIMPNYNHGKYLKDSIAAIQNQKFSNFELIIIDDASTDESVKIIKNFRKKYKNIKLIQNKKNMAPRMYITDRPGNAILSGRSLPRKSE